MAEQLTTRLDGFDKPTVWHEFTPLAIEHKAVNLGQGFPDWPCEQFVKDAAKDALQADFNQYARPQGHRKLVEVLADKYSKEFKRAINWSDEIAIGVGATETIYSAVHAFVQPGDEVIVVEPAFDIYTAQVQMAGGTCRFVPLHVRTIEGTEEKEFYLDESALAAAFNDRTRAVMLNNPHNPTGKVFTREELELIAKYVRLHPRVVVISDEVYEHILFDGKTHVRIAMLDGMWERTLTVSSAGKTFSVTGWKVGWAVGPRELIKGIYLVNNWVQFSVSTPFQEAVANMLVAAEQPYKGFRNFYAFVADMYQRKRDRLAKALLSVGIKPIMPSGGIFLYSDISAIDVPAEHGAVATNVSPDWAFCRWLTIAKGVTSLPTSVFFSDANKSEGHQWARFAYCKTDEAIEEAIKRLEALNFGMSERKWFKLVDSGGTDIVSGASVWVKAQDIDALRDAVYEKVKPALAANVMSPDLVVYAPATGVPLDGDASISAYGESKAHALIVKVKTYFGYVVLYHLAHVQGITVVYESGPLKKRVLFSGDVVVKGSPGDLIEILDRPTAYYIVDAVKPAYYPAKTILLTSPRREIWYEFNKTKCRSRYMPPSLKNDFIDGRYVLEFAEIDDQQQQLELAINGARLEYLKNAVGSPDGNDDSISHRLLQKRVTHDFMGEYFVFASQYVQDEVYNRLYHKNKQELLQFIATSDGVGAIAVIRGHLFEFKKMMTML